MRFFGAVFRLMLLALALVHALVFVGMTTGYGLPHQGVLAFSVPINRISEWHIVIMDVRTRKIFQVGEYGWRLAVALEWSPDGQRLAYSTYSPRSDIFVIDIYAGQHRNITDDWAEDRYPSWSPDSQQVVFFSARDSLGYDLYVAPVHTPTIQRLTFSEAMYPVWSPDGTQIAYSSRVTGDLYSLDTTCLTCEPRRLTSTRFDDRNPTWSPDGQSIAFISFHEARGSTGDQIFVMNQDGNNLRLLASGWRFQGTPAWSPDSRSIAFVGKDFTERQDSIYVVNVDSPTPPRKIADDAYYAYNERWPMWSPDSRYIAFSRRRGGGLYVVDTVTGRTNQISHLRAAYPIWQP